MIPKLRCKACRIVNDHALTVASGFFDCIAVSTGVDSLRSAGWRNILQMVKSRVVDPHAAVQCLVKCKLLLFCRMEAEPVVEQ
jgi:hypothetical protein